MPRGVYKRSPQHLKDLREHMARVRAQPGWKEKVAPKPGPRQVRLPIPWSEERKRRHGEIMSNAGVVVKLLRRRTAAPQEVVLRNWLEGLGFVWQYRVGRIGVADYGNERLRLLIEFESKFQDPSGNSRLAIKLRRFKDTGWRCLVFGYWHVYLYPEHVKQEILDALI